MGVVWLGTDTRLHRSVALKLGKPGARISDEGVGGAKLMHPNVIAVFDVTEDDIGREWLVMEYLPSRSLSAVRAEDGPLPPRDVATIGTQIASALAHLHGKGMVHRDVAPANVLITPDKTAKLTDFGIATWESETRTEDPKTDGGTRGFQAPEVVRGNRATPASDVYSLGATLLTAVEGDLSPEAAPNAPLRTTLAGLTHTDPDRRPTAEQVQRQLADLVWTRSRRARWIVAAAVVLVLALLLWWVNPFRPAGTAASGPTRGGAAPGTGSLMGDPRTADPCALTYANALIGFGEVDSSNDYGNFNRCDALVYLSKDHHDLVDVKVEFDTGQQDPTAPIQRDGVIGIQRPPAQTDDCTRILLLPNNYQVIIDANETGHETVDLCGMAETITNSALIALGNGPIARRSLPPASLAGKDACALLDNHTVTSIVGPGPIAVLPSFANWRCDWDYTMGPILVKVIFDRTPAEDVGGPVIRVGRYAAVVQAQGYSDTDCLVSLVYRSYVDQGGVQTDEVVLVDLDDTNKPPQQLCAPAQRLATAVAGRLAG